MDHADLLFRLSLVTSSGGSLIDSVVQKLSVNFQQLRPPGGFQLRLTALTAGVLIVQNRAPFPTPIPTCSSNATFSVDTRPNLRVPTAQPAAGITEYIALNDTRPPEGQGGWGPLNIICAAGINKTLLEL